MKPPDPMAIGVDQPILRLGVGIGFLLFTNPEARQVTADLLRAAGDAPAPAVENKTLEDRINEVLVGK